MNRGLVIGLVGAAALTGGLLDGFAPSPAEGYGLPPSGPVVDAGLPAMRVLALGACAFAVGWLLAAVRAPAGRDGLLSPAGYAGLTEVRRWSLVQAGASLAVAGLTVAENSGSVTLSTLFVGVRYIEPATGWLLCALVAAGVAGAAGWVLTWRAAVGLLLVALGGPLCAALTATTNAQRSHDIAGDALAAQTLALVFLLGAALAGYRARWCLPVATAGAVVTAAYAVPAGKLLNTGYGQLTLAGLVLLALTALPRVRHKLTQSLALPAFLLTLLCVHTALTRVAAPADQGYQASKHVYLVGYDLPGGMTWADLALRWRPDLVFGSLAVVAAVLYLAGVRRLDEPWPRRYTLAWLSGCAMLLVATSSGVGRYAPGVFSVHMGQHMLLAGLAPALLVLGHGGTLALRASKAPDRLRALLDARTVRLAGHPLVAWLAVAGTLFGVYPTGLFEAWQQEHWAHLVMNAAFFLTGLALMRVVLGGDASLPPIGRLVMVFAVMALHAGFAAWLLGLGHPVGEVFYRSLALPFVPDPLADQRLGALLSWVLGEVPVILAVLALVRRWAVDDERAPCEQPHVFTLSGTPRAAELTGRL